MPVDIMGVKRRLFTLLQDVNLVNAYLKQFGPVINAMNIKEIKYGGKGAGLTKAAAGLAPKKPGDPAAAAKGGAAAAPVAEAAEQDPIYEMSVNCPVCGRTKITNYELRAKTQQVMQTTLLVPVYVGTSGYATVDYTRLAVTVCPDCLFATPDKKNFNYPSFTGTSEEKSSLPIGVIMNMKDSTEERKKLLPAALGNPDYFKRERSAKVAIESYRLAMARAEIEAELIQPYAYYKLGSYMLKIAYIEKCEKLDDTESLREALKHFEKSFAKSECTSEEIEMQVLYLVVALNIRLGDLNTANAYLATFGKLLNERLAQMKKDPSLTEKWIEKWQDKSKYLWEEREDLSIFDK